MPIVIVDGLEDESGSRPGAIAVTRVVARTRLGYSVAGLNRADWYWEEPISDICTIGAAIRVPDMTGPDPSDRWTFRLIGFDPNPAVNPNNHIPQIFLRINNDGSMEVLKNPASAVRLGITGPGVFPNDPQKWNYVELQCRHSSGGFIHVRLNGTTVLQAGANTIPTNNARPGYGGAGFGVFSATRGALPAIYDDMYIGRGPTTMVGDAMVVTIYPNGNGSRNEFLGSDGDSQDNWNLVNDFGNVNSYTNTYSDVPGAVDLYQLENVSVGRGPIHAVCHAANIGKSDSGAVRGQIVNRVDGETFSDPYPILHSPGRTFHRTWEQNPETGATWTEAEVNKLQSGVAVA